MDAGTLRARQILFWDTMRGDAPDPTMTKRGANEELPEYASPDAYERRGSVGFGSRTGSPTRGRDSPGGERLNSPMYEMYETPQRRIESPG